LIYQKIGCINFHSAPLPEFRGVSGYNFAIYQNLNYWGVSVHFVDESFDGGEIIKVAKFDIDPKKETAFSLEQKSQTALLELFKEIVNTIQLNGTIPSSPQGGGKYYSKEDFERLRRISRDDSIDDIERKIRAFWYPPYGGAYVKIKGKEFTLINDKLLEEINDMYWNSRVDYTKKLESKTE